MEHKIIDFLDQNGYTYDKITNPQSLLIIYDLLINGVTQITNFDDPIIYYYCGVYHYINHHLDEMFKYYLTAVDKGVASAMNDLGCYYEEIRDYNQMFKYYQMAVEHGCTISMYNLGSYYQDVGNYTQMEKYYLMAVSKGDISSMYNLGSYYQDVGDYQQMKKYYQMAIQRGHIISMHNLGYYYDDIEDYQLMTKYYLMAINNGHVDSMYNLAQYYQIQHNYEPMKIYYLMAINRGDLESLHQLADYYQQIKDIEEMVNLYLLAIEKYHDKSAINKLAAYFNNNIGELWKLIQYNIIIKHGKSKYTQLIIKRLPLAVQQFRFRDQSLASKILAYNFALQNGRSDQEIYQEIINKDKVLVYYLNITSNTQIKDVLHQYINTYCS